MSETVKKVGTGEFGSNSHPIHPTAIHFPIAFLLASSILDVTTIIGLQYPALLYPLMKITTNSSAHTNNLDTIALLSYLSLFSYASTVAAVLTSIPAILTGAIEFYALKQKRGLDFKNLDPVVRTALIHAGLNNLAFAGAIYNWLSRRNRDGYELSTLNGWLSFITLFGVAYSAFLGGALVYSHAVGVQRMGKGKEEKEEQLEKTKEQARKKL